MLGHALGAPARLKLSVLGLARGFLLGMRGPVSLQLARAGGQSFFRWDFGHDYK